MSAGIFYSSTSGATKAAAEEIKSQLAPLEAEIYDIEEVSSELLNNYDFIILGASTMGIGELSDEWEDWIETIEKKHVENKKVAIFGLGDQEGYEDSFVDAIGIIYDHVGSMGPKMVGSWPVEGYEFVESKAKKGDEFVGLALDDDTQPDLTKKRIAKWVSLLKDQL
jgi:flavodoxin I